MSNNDGNWPRPPGFAQGVREGVFLYGAPPLEPEMPFRPFPPAPDSGAAFIPGPWELTCTRCSGSRILWGSAGAEPCPACCSKLIIALHDKETRAEKQYPLKREVDRLKAKVNRLLRKLTKRP